MSCFILSSSTPCGSTFAGLPASKFASEAALVEFFSSSVTVPSITTQFGNSFSCPNNQNIPMLRYQISYWCSRIVSDAIRAGCPSQNTRQPYQLCSQECSESLQSFLDVSSTCPATAASGSFVGNVTSYCNSWRNSGSCWQGVGSETSSCGFLDQSKACQNPANSGISCCAPETTAAAVLTFGGVGKPATLQAPTKPTVVSSSSIEETAANKNIGAGTASGTGNSSTLVVILIVVPALAILILLVFFFYNKRSKIDRTNTNPKMSFLGKSILTRSFVSPKPSKRSANSSIQNSIPMEPSASQRSLKRESDTSCYTAETFEVVSSKPETEDVSYTPPPKRESIIGIKQHRASTASQDPPSPTVSAPVAPEQAALIMRVKFGYVAQLPDELTLNMGDKVIILLAFNDGWAFGVSQTTEAKGAFPIVCVSKQVSKLTTGEGGGIKLLQHWVNSQGNTVDPQDKKLVELILSDAVEK